MSVSVIEKIIVSKCEELCSVKKRPYKVDCGEQGVSTYLVRPIPSRTSERLCFGLVYSFPSQGHQTVESKDDETRTKTRGMGFTCIYVLIHVCV